MPSGKVLILSDGGPVSLLACASVRESIALGEVGKGLKEAPVDAAVLPFPPTRPRPDAHAGQCELFTLPVLAPGAGRDDPAMPRGEAESHDLLAATHLAARNGFTAVLWPATAGAGEGLDLDRIAQITDRAILISRLVAIDSAAHGIPSIHIETPYADFTDRQVADLIADMELPIETCWWWDDENDVHAQRERQRWTAALGAVGWTKK